jgi:hypothetical protein
VADQVDGHKDLVTQLLKAQAVVLEDILVVILEVAVELMDMLGVVFPEVDLYLPMVVVVVLEVVGESKTAGVAV